jgi:hypothetical protein
MDLNSLVDLPAGMYLSEATAINNAGQVTAIASPIPEPQTYALFLAGLGLIGFMVRRKKAHKFSPSLSPVCLIWSSRR